MTRLYKKPRPLGDDDHVAGFRCRSAEQTLWLRRHARQSNAAGGTRVFVVTERGRKEVVAFYAWCMASIRIKDVPLRVRQGAGRYPQPAALLARLGVSVNHEGQGLGAGLLKDVLARTAQLGMEIGCRGLLVHTESPGARAFYQHLVPEFMQSPTDALHLVLLMKDIHQTLRAAAP